MAYARDAGATLHRCAPGRGISWPDFSDPGVGMSYRDGNGPTATTRATTIADVLKGLEPMGDLSRFAIEDLTPDEENEFFSVLHAL